MTILPLPGPWRTLTLGTSRLSAFFLRQLSPAPVSGVEGAGAVLDLKIEASLPAFVGGLGDRVDVEREAGVVLYRKDDLCDVALAALLSPRRSVTEAEAVAQGARGAGGGFIEAKSCSSAWTFRLRSSSFCSSAVVCVVDRDGVDTKEISLCGRWM